MLHFISPSFFICMKKTTHTEKHKQTIERIFQKPSVAKRKFKKKIEFMYLFYGLDFKIDESENIR